MCIPFCDYTSVLICSAFDGRLGCFYLEGIMNNVTKNIFVQVFDELSFLPDKYPGIDWAGFGHTMFTFSRYVKLSPNWLYHFKFPLATFVF